MAKNVTTRALSGGFWQVECFEEVQLLRCGVAYSLEAAASGICRVFLNARQDVEGELRTCVMAFGLQAHAHDSVQGEGQKADQRMGADTVGQSVMNWRDLDVRFQDAKAPLDIP
ncbi:hypothetical protein BD293_0077 [Roseinatronobacter monicus]|uniref:Uncharacterized protein n=1 Tax=Roseinatronobacter monicus TaxID=393481 RepID=A0A543K8Z3_9RHOB|nr:hypothetical protein BD293_0077 [Roseinatronobacter monicus]